MLEGFNTANDESAQESKFYRELGRLPKELSEKWLQDYENLETENTELFFNKFQAFILERNKALSGTLEIYKGNNEQIRAEINSIHDAIRNTFGDLNFFLGNGRTAEVYIYPLAPHLCLKYIKDQDAYNENNHLRVEYSFLDKLYAHSSHGVRTPRPYFIRIHPSEGHMYGMERILGENLSRIIEKPSENMELVRMLKHMDQNTVEKKLVGYIESLHRTFKISHNDLYCRNLMVDKEGNFFVLDFGKAKYEEIGEDHEQFRKSDITRVVSEIRQFFVEIDKIDIS